MKVNEMVFFDALRNIEKRLDKAYMHIIIPMSPSKTIEDYKRRTKRFWDSMEAVREAQKDLELLLTLVTENPWDVGLQCAHARSKANAYKILEINPPMSGSPIGVAVMQPVAVKKTEGEDEED